MSDPNRDGLHGIEHDIAMAMRWPGGTPSGQLMVGVKCACCRRFDKTQNTPLVGDFHRQIDVWRCDQCGEPCSNRRCNGYQSASIEEGAR